MRFDEAMDYLDAHTNLEANAGWVAGLSLDRITNMVGVLGDPQDQYPVIHITGTNGKGSVSAMTSALLEAHGLEVGRYTSPHLEHITERISRTGGPIPEADLGRALGELAGLESMFGGPPSYFDLLTAAAFSWFAETAVDAAVVEVGLLGRYDSTNVVNAAVAVITNVGLDHTDGEPGWAARIADEKSGIIKPDSSVVVGPVTDEVADIVTRPPHRTLARIPHDVTPDDHRVAVGGRVFTLSTPRAVYPDLFVSMHGRHQADNAAVAVAAVEAFFGRSLDDDLVRSALASVGVPGRFEVVSRSPLVILDSAHNPDGAQAAAATITEEFDPAGPLTLVVGLLGGRDPAQVIGPLLELDPTTVILARADSPRAQDPEDVAERIAGRTTAEIRIVADVGSAVAGEIDQAGADDCLFVFGSQYVVGDARGELRRLGLVS